VDNSSWPKRKLTRSETTLADFFVSSSTNTNAHIYERTLTTMKAFTDAMLLMGTSPTIERIVLLFNPIINAGKCKHQCKIKQTGYTTRKLTTISWKI